MASPAFDSEPTWSSPWPHGRRSLPRRVLMTADTVGGVWTYAIDLCRGLDRAGVEVVLATMGPPVSAAQCAEAAAIPGVRLEEYVGKLEWMDEAEADVARAGSWLLELEQQHRPDLIHLNGYAHAAMPWQAPVLLVAHSCVHTWWRAVHGDRPPSSFEHYTRALRRGVAAAERIVAPTAAFLAAFGAEHGPLPPADVVPNGREPAQFQPAEKEPFFLSVGRLWDEGKNAQVLATVAPQLPWPVRVAGSATSPDGRSLDLPNVELLGRCTPEMVAELMARAAVYVLPARYEPFGLSVLEAALSGCALVLSDIATLREVWGDAALYVPSGQADMLQATLDALARDDEARTGLGQRARAHALQYTVAAMTHRYLAIYRTLLESSLAAGPAAGAIST